MVDKAALKEQMARKWSIKPSLAEKMVDIITFMVDKREVTTEDIITEFCFAGTTAKRYMRQLTDFGCIGGAWRQQGQQLRPDQRFGVIRKLGNYSPQTRYSFFSHYWRGAAKLLDI